MKQKLKSVGGKDFVVNLLADFILNEIPKKEKSIIKVVDCDNFYVIKGKTSSKEVLVVNEVVTKFQERFQQYVENIKLSHTIDLIEYDVDMDKVDKIEFTFYNHTSNCSYHYLEIENSGKTDNQNEMVFVSSFPHGYSLNQGRLLYYYGKHIFYNIPSNYPITTMTFRITDKKTDDGVDFNAFDEYFQEDDFKLKSAVLDVFDFNYSKFKKDIEEINIYNELINPLEEHEQLKKIVKDFIII